ncbi:hypothetical protein WMY93_024445 [Mugilogobius chulae]|uniref:Uncharacterized protein n=1 Tax=Mugilogobius chulae TaxID=88201 RepID=A0AAW0N4F4_9GOBI
MKLHGLLLVSESGLNIVNGSSVQIRTKHELIQASAGSDKRLTASCETVLSRSRSEARDLGHYRKDVVSTSILLLVLPHKRLRLQKQLQIFLFTCIYCMCGILQFLHL